MLAGCRLVPYDEIHERFAQCEGCMTEDVRRLWSNTVDRLISLPTGRIESSHSDLCWVCKVKLEDGLVDAA